MPGSSVLHRAPAGLKLAVLGVGLAGLGWLRSATALAVAALVVLALIGISRVGPRVMLRQVRPLLWVILTVGALQVWLDGPRQAVLVVGSLVVTVAAAGLVTVTTRTQDLLDALVAGLRPFRRLGVDPERTSLVLSLAIRSVPVIAGLADEVRAAMRARGVERSVRAFAVPLVIRTIRYADRLGEALAARGVDDD